MKLKHLLTEIKAFILRSFHQVKTYNQKEAEKNSMALRANDYLKHYEKLYETFWNAEPFEDVANYSMVYEARYVGKKYFGIESEAFDLIQYKIENSIARTL